MTVTTAASLPNDTRLKELLSRVRALGGTHAEGNEALQRFFMEVAEGGRDQYLNLDKNTDKQDVIDTLYGEYVKGFSKKASDQHTPEGMSSNKSKARAVLKASVKPNVDFPLVIDSLIRIRAEKAKAVKCFAPAAAIVSAARLQQKQDDNLSDDQIAEVVVKPDPKDKTHEGQAKKALKIVEDLITGDGGLPALGDNEHLIRAQEGIQAYLNGFQVSRDEDEARAILAKLGWTVVETTVE